MLVVSLKSFPNVTVWIRPSVDLIGTDEHDLDFILYG